MRALLTMILVFHCAQPLVAGQLPPLTVKEINLMLRSGYSSETILKDLSVRHFADTLDLETEKQLMQANASPALLHALKSGSNTASPHEVAEARQRIAQAKIAAQAAAQHADTQQAVASPNTQIVVARDSARAEADAHFAAEAARAYAATPQGRREARARWCAEHPIECEAQRAEGEIQSLKTSLWLQGIHTP